jgi:hypothetical protein
VPVFAIGVALLWESTRVGPEHRRRGTFLGVAGAAFLMSSVFSLDDS